LGEAVFVIVFMAWKKYESSNSMKTMKIRTPSGVRIMIPFKY